MRSTARSPRRATTVRRLVVDGRDVSTCELADTAWRRMIGLLGRRQVVGAMLFVRCTSVHGMGMAISLDVAQLADGAAGGYTVVRTRRMRPMGLVGPRRGVRHVLEAQAGAFDRWGLHAGSRLELIAPVPDAEGDG